MILIVTDNDVSDVTGGLERAAKKFGVWLESIDYVNFYTAKNLLLNRALSRDCVILLVGHRSMSILAFAFYCALMRRKFSWCPFWHDYKLEGKKGLRFGLYDLVFKFALSFSKHHFVVSNYEKINTGTRAPQYIVRLPGFIDDKVESGRSSKSSTRNIDMLFVGRDVPHKQRGHAQKIADQLDLRYVEVIPGEGHISDVQLSNAYQNTKVVFIPSMYESYSLVAVEALLAGAVVVAFPNVLVGEGLHKLSRFVVVSEDDMLPALESEVGCWRPVSTEENIFIRHYFSNDNCKKLFLSFFK